MNKADLVKEIAGKAKLTNAQATSALENFTKSVSGALKKGDKVTLIGFGTFSVVKRAARKGRNPKTGKPLSIPAKKVAKFSVGKALKAKVK